MRLSSSKLNADSSATTTHLLVKKSAAPVTKEELGRATWTFLHTLAAQYPENPTRQQRRICQYYPECTLCKECADHFKEVLRMVRSKGLLSNTRKLFCSTPHPDPGLANPVQAGSHDEFSQWLCHVHNVVNRSLGKLVFQCERVDAKWGKLECEQRACDLQGTTTTNHIEF
ncbi:hypothetical protein DITRI_Ditri01bG0072300 [Diplodiscus trichospermus]